MTTMYYEIEIAHRREELLRLRQEAGSSRRQLRRRARRESGTTGTASTAATAAAGGLRPVPAPRLG